MVSNCRIRILYIKLLPMPCYVILQKPRSCRDKNLLFLFIRRRFLSICVAFPGFDAH
uniref:Uncharacterized protein n=1 Tax=Arundo donax TaxID=35708 RepID=A0A0A8XWQ0_ARUDO